MPPENVMTFNFGKIKISMHYTFPSNIWSILTVCIELHKYSFKEYNVIRNTLSIWKLTSILWLRWRKWQQVFSSRTQLNSFVVCTLTWQTWWITFCLNSTSTPKYITYYTCIVCVESIVTKRKYLGTDFTLWCFK